MILRDYVPSDAEALAAVYRDAALTLGRQGYTEEQTRVWAMHPEDIDEFRETLSKGLTLCAVVDDHPVAFGQINPIDHIAYLYCASPHARSGYGSAILGKLEEHARSAGVSPLRVEASSVARPFFAHHGYLIVEEERVLRHGVKFVRFKMKKDLGNQALC
jgi:GNAT superfamily N-acetyltransferase